MILVSHCRSPLPLFSTPPNPSGKDAMTTTQGDSIPPTIAVPRHRCPRTTSRWASSTLIIVVIVDVVATLPPSNDIHGVHHGATAGRGTSNNANFGGSGSQCRRIFAPVVLLSRWSGNPRRGRGRCVSSGSGASIIVAASSQRIDVGPVAKSSPLSSTMLMAASSTSALLSSSFGDNVSLPLS